MGYKIIVQSVDEDAQLLNVSFVNPPILHDDEDIQLILDLGEPVTKTVIIGGEFNSTSFNSIRLASYLMQDNLIVNAASCVFNVYSVNQPNWQETLLYTGSGAIQVNNYFYLDIPLTSLSANLDGSTTLMVDVSLVRLGKTYKNRLYLNQLGIYSTTTMLNNNVNFLNITKKDD